MKPFIAVVLLASTVISSPAFSQGYSAKSYISNGQSAVLTGLNNSGQVVGYSGTGANTMGFVSGPNAGDLNYLTILAGSDLVSEPRPTAINDSGMVVGSAKTEYQFYQSLQGNTTRTTEWAFVAGTDLSVQAVMPKPTYVFTDDYYVPSLKATDINASGKILVTDLRTSAAAGGDFLSAAGSFSYYYMPYGAVTDFAGVSRINDSGQIVVSSSVNTARLIAPDLTLANTQSPRTLLGVPYLALNSINASGQTVGVLDASPDAGYANNPRAFLAESGFTGWKELDGFTPTAPSYAFDINDFGQVVGSAEDANGVSRAFVTGNQGEGFTDLNSLVSLSSGEYLVSASRINEVGQILAQSNLGIHYFLNPSAVPETSTLALMALGLLAVSMVRRQQLKA
jgi:probable HAF family extracellular repeat protein